jgi:hypothetical protein
MGVQAMMKLLVEYLPKLITRFWGREVPQPISSTSNFHDPSYGFVVELLLSDFAQEKIVIQKAPKNKIGFLTTVFS